MKKERTIAWQKYEDYIEKQISSPVLSNILQNIASLRSISIDEENDEDDDYVGIANNEENNLANSITPIPLTSQLIDDLFMLSSFDCWIGHTNFDITTHIKNELDKIPGVEVLKVLSRYRFFIGLGQLFDFKNVRKDIEKKII